MTPLNRTSVTTPYASTAVVSLEVCHARPASTSATLITPKPTTFQTAAHLSTASVLPNSMLSLSFFRD